MFVCVGLSVVLLILLFDWSSFFRVPYEVVKQRLQVGAYPSTMVALTSIYKEVKQSRCSADGYRKIAMGNTRKSQIWCRHKPFTTHTTFSGYFVAREAGGGVKFQSRNIIFTAMMALAAFVVLSFFFICLLRTKPIMILEALTFNHLWTKIEFSR